MPTGTVKQFSADKGFGFITPSDGGDDVFVHRKVQGGDRTAYLEEGQEVEYEVEWSEKAQKYAASSCTGFKTEAGGKAKGKGDKGKGKGKDKGKDGKDGKGKGKGDDKSTRAPRYGNEDAKTDSSNWGVRDISKKLSWVLRNGAPHLGVNMDKDGWVRVDNLLGSEALPKLTTERLMKVIEESNEQKPRYEIYNSGKKDMAVRAGGAKTAANRGERDRRDDRGGRDRRRDRDSDRDRDREPPTSPSLSQALQNLPLPSKSGSTLNASAGEWKPGQSSAMAAASAAYQMQMQMQQAMAYQMAYQQQAWQAMQAAQQGYGGKGGKGKAGGGKGGGRGNGGGGRGRGKDQAKTGKPEAKADKDEVKEGKAEAKAEGDAPAAEALAASPPAAEPPAPATPAAEA